MRTYSGIAVLALASAALASSTPALAQSFSARFHSRNGAMTEVQPSWMGPLIQSDARISQGAKLSVSNERAPGEQIFSYGNNHGISLLGGRRFQFDFNPPSFFRNHSPSFRDGFGNANTQVKCRLASGNAAHGNFAVTAGLGRSIGGGVLQNGLLSSYYFPKILAGKAFGRFVMQSSLSALLPTAKIALQGREVDWNNTAQLHPWTHAYFDIEDNGAWFKKGPNDGRMENFITPAAFYVLPHRGETARTAFVLDAGMQIATSGFHAYNHNLITELRVMF